MERYDAIVELMGRCQTVLRDAVVESEMEETKRASILGDIHELIVQGGHRSLGSIYSVAFRDKSTEEQQELVDWFRGMYNDLMNEICEAIGEATEKMKEQQAELEKRRDATLNKLQAQKMTEAAVQLLQQSQPQGRERVDVQTPEQAVAHMTDCEARGYQIKDMYWS